MVYAASSAPAANLTPRTEYVLKYLDAMDMIDTLRLDSEAMGEDGNDLRLAMEKIHKMLRAAQPRLTAY